MLDSAALVGSLHVTASNQSLSSYLVSAENKSSRSTRLISFREDNSERSIFSSSRSRVCKDVGHANKTIRRSVVEEADSSRSTDVPKETINNVHEEMNTFHLQRLPPLLKAYTLMVPLLLKLSADLYGKNDVYFTLREYLEGCSSSEIDAMFLLLSHWDANKYSTILKLIMPHTIPQQDYTASLKNAKKVGDGAFGVVYEVLCNSKRYAVKTITREQTQEDSFKIIEVYNEVRCLQLLQKYPIAPSFIDCRVDASSYMIIMESGIMSVGEWRRQWCMIENPQQNLRLLLLVYKEMLQAVKLMHQLGIVHCDIKCDNFILRRLPQDSDDITQISGTIFAVDFGESVILEYDYAKRSRGTLQIQSPAMLAVNSSNGVASNGADSVVSFADDIWSCGCLLYEILAGEYLFINKSWAELYTLLVASKDFNVDENALRLLLVKLPFSVDLVSSLATLISRVLRVNPTTRYSIEEILTGINDILSGDAGRSDHEPANDLVQNGEPFCYKHFNESLSRINLEDRCLLPRGILIVAENILLSFGIPLSSIQSAVHGTIEDYSFKECSFPVHEFSIFTSAAYSSIRMLRSLGKNFGANTEIYEICGESESQSVFNLHGVAQDKLCIAVIESREDESTDELVSVPNSAIHSFIWTLLVRNLWSEEYTQNIQWLFDHIFSKEPAHNSEGNR